MNKINYHKKMMDEIKQLKDDKQVKRLLLHSCCGPCSSYVLELLMPYFDITVFYYNPNIHPKEEYEHRLKEQIRIADELGLKQEVMGDDYQPDLYFEAVEGLEDLGEFSERCFACYEQRMAVTASFAKSHSFDYFATTLSISPLKNAVKINDIGLKLEKDLGIKYLVSDFKKNNGYKRSVELSREHELYRQDYCGCIYSKEERLGE